MNGAKSDRRDEEEVRCKDGGSYLPVTALYGRDSLSVTPHPPAHLPRSCRSPLFGSVPVTRSRGSLDVRRERRGREKGNREERSERA